MGLLEDAIREHLELKRLRGADPAEVAREQHEALESPISQEPTAWVDDDRTAVDEAGSGAAGQAPAPDAPVGEDLPADVPQAAAASDFSHSGQETAELDMQTVLADQPPSTGEPAAPGSSYAAEGGSGPSGAAAEEDSLEWEVPPRASGDELLESEQQIEEHHDGALELTGEHATAAGSADELEEGRSDAQQHATEQGHLSF